MITHFIRANGIAVHSLDHPGPEPALVLLSGLTANAHSFDALTVAGLVPQFRVLALDLRGRGQSDAPPAGFDPAAPAANYTMPDHAADVLGVLDELGLRQAVLVGHSFGGMLALYLAARAPGRFPRIVVLDWAMGLATPTTLELLRPTLSRLGRVAPSWEAYLATIKQMPCFHGWWDPAIESFYRADLCEGTDGSVRARARPDAIQAALHGARLEDWPAILADVRQPVLLVNARGPFGPPGTPPFLPHDQALATAEALADCRYLAVPGNHMTMLYGDNARQIAAAIAAFVREGNDTG